MPHNVLIVDDSATMREMVKRTLRMAGLDVDGVYEASNGIEALARLAEHEITVILVDINMPTMNGIQLLTRMKQNQRLRHIPSWSPRPRAAGSVSSRCSSSGPTATCASRSSRNSSATC